jgi:hypothetical protein
MRAGAKAGERPARWWQSQESVNPDCTPFPWAAQARGGDAIEGLVLQSEAILKRPTNSSSVCLLPEEFEPFVHAVDRGLVHGAETG